MAASGDRPVLITKCNHLLNAFNIFMWRKYKDNIFNDLPHNLSLPPLLTYLSISPEM